jgi:hypothetical protein
MANDTVTVMEQAWTKSVHAAYTEQDFISQYMGTGYEHIYQYLSAKDKEKTLKVAYKLLDAKPPVTAEKKK